MTRILSRWGTFAPLVLLFVLAPAVKAVGQELRIGRIEIVTSDVFTDEEAARGAAYRVTNTLHIQTRESVIRKFLLFKEGEAYVHSRLEESERSLRALPFLHSASITAAEPTDGVVDVLVVTQDSWSTQPSASVGSAGGETDFGIEIEETNFLGLGKAVSFLYESGVERSGLGVRYSDAAAFGRQWRTGALIMNNSDGGQVEVMVSRPFYSFATSWAVSTELIDRRFQSRIYEGGEISSEFDQIRESIEASYGFAFSPSDSKANRLSFGIDLQTDEFSPLLDGSTSVLPDDREYRYVFVDYEYARNQFAKRDFVNRDIRVEDFRIGTRVAVRAGISPRAFGVEETTGLFAASIHRGLDFGPLLLLGDLGWESRIGAPNRNEVTSAELKLIRKYDALAHPQTTVARVVVRYGRDLDADRQFFADGGTGLRGYRLYSFAGDSSIIINVEHRLFLGREIWQFMSPSLAAFVDAGNASNGSSTFHLSNLKVDAGLGVRLGLTRTARNIFRLDFAYAFDPDPFGRKGWLVSFSGHQAF